MARRPPTGHPRGRPRLGGRVVSIRISDAVAERAEVLAAALPALTTPARLLARAAEIGLAEVERELAVVASRGPRNGTSTTAVLETAP